MGEAPAFQFYASDFLGDPAVIAMTLEERGAYITLLCIAWMQEGISADTDTIRRMLHATPRRFERMWPAIESCWKSNGNGRLVNPRMEKVRTEQRKYLESRSRAGKLGMKKRWGSS